MKIVVGTLPNAKAPLDHDVLFVKASAVYASSVSFYSPTFLGIDPLVNFREQLLPHQLFYLAMIFKDPGFVQGEVLSYSERQNRLEKARSRFDKFHKLLQEVINALEVGGPRIDLEFNRISSEVAPYIDMVASRWTDNSASVKRVKELRRASELGLVSIKRFDENPDIYFNRGKLVESIYSELSNPGSFGLLDERFYGNGKLSGAVSTRTKVTQLATSIFSHLPTFENASFDEIFDIRNELNKYTTRFRRALFELADSIESEPFQEDFVHDVEKLVVSKVLPSVNEIEEAVRSNSYLRELVTGLVKNPLVVPATSGLGLILGNANIVSFEASGVASAIGGAALISYDAFVEWKEKRNLTRKNDLFLVYGLNRKLQK